MVEFSEKFWDWTCTSLEEVPFPDSWRDPQLDELVKSISEVLSSSKAKIYPSPDLVFRSLYEVNPEEVKLVILGQDPYHNGNATGLCFDVRLGNSINPSLRNIYKEMEYCGFSPNKNGDLSHLPSQGVLLLNTALTVGKSDPGSHTSLWSEFSEKIISKIENPKVHWLLMGNAAQDFLPLIKSKYIFRTSHPSPFSATRSTKQNSSFIGSRVFQRINKSLDLENLECIKW